VDSFFYLRVTDSVAAFFPNPWLTFAGLLLRLSFWPLPIKLKGLKGVAYFLPAVKQIRAPQRTGPEVNLAEEGLLSPKQPLSMAGTKNRREMTVANKSK